MAVNYNPVADIPDLVHQKQHFIVGHSEFRQYVSVILLIN